MSCENILKEDKKYYDNEWILTIVNTSGKPVSQEAAWRWQTTEADAKSMAERHNNKFAGKQVYQMGYLTEEEYDNSGAVLERSSKSPSGWINR